MYKWYKFKSNSEHFEILFPTKCQIKTQSLVPNSGTTVYFSSSFDGYFQLAITHLVFGRPLNGVDKLLESALEMFIRDINGAILKSKNFLTFRDLPALDFELNVQNGLLKGIIFLPDEQRLFTLSVFPYVENNNYDKFVNSLKLLKS